MLHELSSKAFFNFLTSLVLFVSIGYVFSKSTIDLIELLKKTVDSAAKSESETVAGRLVETARNIVQLFICIAPRHHHTQISSVPQIAGMFPGFSWGSGDQFDVSRMHPFF